MSDQAETAMDNEQAKPKTSPEEFAKRYQSLCDEMGYRIVVSPVWLARDDGTFSMQLQYSIEKLPQK